jgi:hypothetical protein
MLCAEDELAHGAIERPAFRCRQVGLGVGNHQCSAPATGVPLASGGERSQKIERKPSGYSFDISPLSAIEIKYIDIFYDLDNKILSKPLIAFAKSSCLLSPLHTNQRGERVREKKLLATRINRGLRAVTFSSADTSC